jgi:hypothetical protein
MHHNVKLFIGGQWRDGTGERTIDVKNQATEAVIGNVARAEDLDIALRARFIDEVASKFFPRHGIELLGAFVGLKDDMTRFEDEAAREKAWAAFSSDPEWGKVTASVAQGPMLKQQTVSVLSPAISGLVLASQDVEPALVGGIAE